MRQILPLALFLAVAPGLPSCTDEKSLLRGKQIADRGELVGGPVAMADVGDFLLENDQIRVAILGAKDSPGPGVFGGSIVDIDVRRSRLGFENAQGRDRFAEAFPVANLLVPDPGKMEVRVLKDGKDGKEAAIRVEGEGAFLFEALSILQKGTQGFTLDGFFPALKTKLHFRTDYILRPGDRHITLRTTLLSENPPPAPCAEPGACGATCENGFKADESGCPTCACEDAPLALEPFHGPSSVFDGILGDYTGDAKKQFQAGVVAGDFVFFGNQNDVFAPPIGYDEEKAVNDAFYAGQNTFKSPLTFDFVAAAGGDVSYGYFTAPGPGEDATVVNVPLFTSAATAFLSAGKRCLYDPADDAACDNKRAFTYERYLAVGDGDIASVASEIWKVRGTRTGRLTGVVRSAVTGEPSPNAQVFVFQDPGPEAQFASVDELAEANLRESGQLGLLDVIDADVGLDIVEDGDFHGDLPPGRYVVVARSQDGNALSAPSRVEIKAGKDTAWAPVLPTPATIEYRVTDARAAGLTPAKITLYALDAEGKPRERDGLRRVYLGDSRLGNGARAVEHSATGAGSLRIEPGRYRFQASRGPEYSAFEVNDFTLAPGEIKRIDAQIVREVDTTGWMSTDIHLHSQPSFDSGMELRRRVTTVVDEQVELAVPTDHDVATDYTPTIRELFLSPYVATAVSAETTTIEQGHFIAFPLKYDATIVPTHGAYDPTCQGGGEILAGLRKQGDGRVPPLTIVAHPRDGFFGYIDQLSVDPFTLNRSRSLLEGNNPVFRTASCDFDAMEIINGKRFDLVRTASVGEVVDYDHCRARIDAATDEAQLDGICPELGAGMLAPCVPGERFAVCQHRSRSALAWEAMKRILARTPEEQEAIWNFEGDAQKSQAICEVGQYDGAPAPPERAVQPCAYRSGHIDDFFRYLEHGMVKSQIASSDSHDAVHEPGYPRTYFRSSTDAPNALDVAEATGSLREGHAIGTYGPFITAAIGGKTFGEVAPAKEGGKVTLDLRVQTASWFGVDRIEIYENGHQVKLIEPPTKPSDIEDFAGKIELDVPGGRDSWVVIVAMGLKDENLMAKVALDVPFGEIQLSKVTADAFALVPVINNLFKASPSLPDWYPIPAYAVTNPIFLDTGGDGQYDAPLPQPDFCSRPCQDAADCAEGQICLSDLKVCGFNIGEECSHRIPWVSAGD